MAVRIGSRTIQLNHAPSIVGFAAVGAKKEKEGPLADYFDYLSEDSSFGEKTWEKAETLMQKKAIELALQKEASKRNRLIFCLRVTCSTSVSARRMPPVSCSCPSSGCTAPAPPWQKVCVWQGCLWTQARLPLPCSDLLPLLLG